VKTYYIPTGGVLHLGCTHGVVYYQSPLWWQESAQEHRYGLLSFKSPPTAFISDIPVHVKKSQKYTNILSDICRDMAKVAAQSEHPVTECHHLQRTIFAQRYIPPQTLNSASLEQMLDKGPISKPRNVRTYI